MSGPADPEQLALLVHELRSPVAALAAISRVLADEGSETGTLPDLVRLALTACRSVTHIADEAAVGSLERRDVAVPALVCDAVAAVVLEGAHVRASLEEGLPVIRADDVRLRQALDNLVRNAVLHSGSSEDVVVSARRDGSLLLISVADSGVGIPEAEHARIFEQGTRLDASHEGTGTGLAIARSIVQAHGGTLTVDSAPGSGATFTIALPLDDAGATTAG